jgi:hypothetical protein
VAAPKKHRPPPRRVAAHPDLGDMTPKEAVGILARADQEPVETLLLAISVGVFDNDLDRIASILQSRLDALHRAAQIIAEATLKIGDRVHLGHNLRPLYLHGQPARVIAKDGEKWILRLEKPVGRFKDADLRVSASQIETVTST